MWSNSSIRDVLEKGFDQTQQCGKKIATNPGEELKKINQLLKETLDRSSVVVEGIKQYGSSNTNFSVESVKEFATPSINTDLKNLDIASVTLKELENLLSEHNKNRNVSLRIDKEPKETKSEDKPESKVIKEISTENPIAPASKPKSNGLTRPTLKPSEKSILEEEKRVQSVLSFI